MNLNVIASDSCLWDCLGYSIKHNPYSLPQPFFISVFTNCIIYLMI
uniref:Uncharacterized protein n=1 Tax=Anguilla anguilla TaxID=7936 RepID=A0A0E9VZ78_ANGAN